LFLVLVGLTQISGNLSSIPKLNGSNFKIWKESLEILLGCMDLDLALRTDKPTSTEEQPNTANIEKWNRSNRMCLMIIRHSIPDLFRGSIAESENAKQFLAQIEKYFAKNEKGEASSLLTSLTSMRYKGNVIREYIIEMSNLASKLKALNVEIKENLLVHLVLISLPAQFTQFNISYIILKRISGVLMSLSHNVCKKKIGLREKGQKVLTWQLPLVIRRKGNLRMS